MIICVNFCFYRWTEEEFNDQDREPERHRKGKRKESNQVTAVFRTVINFVCPSVQIVLSPSIFILYCKLNRVFVFCCH